jgi:RNA polymerase sigma-70 factor (ECF subfamily)
MTILSDAELTIAIKNREPAGAHVLYDRYAATLFKLICCRLQNPKASAYILNKTFAFVWQEIHNYPADEQRLLVWMAGIARKIAIQEKDHLTHKQYDF